MFLWASSSLLYLIMFFSFWDFISFAPAALVLHCLYLLVFKKWLGPISTLYASFWVYSYVISIFLYDLYKLMTLGCYYYIDLGRWFFCLDLIDSHIVFCLDALSIITSILVLLLTVFALYFGSEYMYREAFINRLLYLLNMFATSVVFLFISYDFFLILLSWECVGLFSFLLVNFYSSRIYTVKAAIKTFVFSRLSDMFMFLTFILSISMFNSTDLSIIFLQTPFMTFHYLFIGNLSIHFLTIYSFSLALSGSIKSAQFFFHVWLPDAMEAPTPASALIHSSTLVVAGIYLIMRFSIIFEFVVFTNYFLVLLGALTLVFGAITATFQNDIKKLVAYSTISQIGYLTCGCGFGCYEEVLLYLIVHAINKAFLFVLVGYTVHFFSGNTDMRQMGGAYLYSFNMAVLVGLSGFNLAGLPYSTGFISKEFLLCQVFRDDFISSFVIGCWLVSFLFTPIYMGTLTFIVYFGPKKSFYSNYNRYDLFNIYLLPLSYLNNFKKLPKQSLPLYQYSVITSKFASLTLFSFFLLITVSGEFYTRTILNYSSLHDVILNSSFMNFKAPSSNSLTLSAEYWAASVILLVFLLTCNALDHLYRLSIGSKVTVVSNSQGYLTFNFLLTSGVIYTAFIPLINSTFLSLLVLGLLKVFFILALIKFLKY